ELDPELVVPNKKLSIDEGAIVPFQRMATSLGWFRRRLQALAQAMNFSLSTPFEKLTAKQKQALLYGTGDTAVDEIEFKSSSSGRVRKYSVTWEGVVTNLERRYKESESEWVKADIERYMVEVDCPACEGKRLKPEMLAVTVPSADGTDRNIIDVAQ